MGVAQHDEDWLEESSARRARPLWLLQLLLPPLGWEDAVVVVAVLPSSRVESLSSPGGARCKKKGVSQYDMGV